jgi:uncharacterized protein involved in outer membrane biogenesis
MRAGRKTTFVIAGGIVALIVIAIVFTLVSFNIDSYRSKIETAASETTGLDVRIKGKMRLSLFPFGLSVKDLHVAGKGGEILSLERIKLQAELMPLLRRQLKVTGCDLVRPTITIVKDVQGKYNFQSAERSKGGPGTSLSLHTFKLSKGTLAYLDQRTGEKTELKEINLVLKDLSVADTSGEIIKNISFTGSMDCKQVLQTPFRIDNIKGPVKADKGVFIIKPLTMDIFGAKGEGDASADESGADGAYKVNARVSNLDFEKFEESFGAAKAIGGKGDLAASLTFIEKSGRNLLNSMDGTLSLRGDNLITYTEDLDKVLSAYETSQKFSLVDVAVYLVAGPLGAVALKGYRYGNVYYQKTRGGQGAITQFISHWKIKDGQADALDCALATRHHRVALKGKLNFVSGRYDTVTVALLDETGCANFTQTITGPFGNPRVGAVSAVESLGGPVQNLYRRAKRFAQSGKCQVFYSGLVKQPR